MPSRSKLGDETVTQAMRTQDSQCCNQAQKNSSHQSLGNLRDIPWMMKNGIEVLQANREMDEYWRQRKKQVAYRHAADMKSGGNPVWQECWNPSSIWPVLEEGQQLNLVDSEGEQHQRKRTTLTPTQGSFSDAKALRLPSLKLAA